MIGEIYLCFIIIIWFKYGLEFHGFIIPYIYMSLLRFVDNIAIEVVDKIALCVGTFHCLGNGCEIVVVEHET